MFDCPYCQHTFATKQRLISHLTRNNKCYDVSTVGVPPILLNLMGFSQKDVKTITPTQIEDKKIITIENKKENEKKDKVIDEEDREDEEEDEEEKETTVGNEDEDGDEEHEDDKKETTPVIDKKTETPTNKKINVCDKCLKKFANQRNLERHLIGGKCHKKSTQQRVVLPDDHIPNIFKSKSENKKIIKTPKKIPPKPTIHPNHKSNVKYIVKENYIDYLTEQMGSEDAALKFVRTCIQGKIKGGINLLYKIYYEGRDCADYPIEVVDPKTKKIYYKTPDNVVLDENATYIKSILVENLRNCYLHFCNQIIEANLDDNDVIFDDYDLGEIQKHVLELSDDKKKDRIIAGLIDQTKK